MRVTPVAALPAALLSVGLLAGCGPSNTAASTSTSGSSSTSDSSAPSTSGSSPATNASADCPTSNTKSFAKTRLAGDLGLAIGSFHRYLYKPYKAGSFKKGANGRIKALIKGGATAALDLKLLNNAQENIKANPTLCTKLYAPMSQAITKLDSIKTNLIHGDVSELDNANTVLGGILSTGNSNGAEIKETS